MVSLMLFSLCEDQIYVACSHSVKVRGIQENRFWQSLSPQSFCGRLNRVNDYLVLLG